MKFKVIGWCDFDDTEIPATRECERSAYHAIIDEVKEKGYCFSGYAHQEMRNGVPVMNDGKKRIFSRRGWGSLMAEARDGKHYMDFTLYAEAFATEEAELRGMPTDSVRVERVTDATDAEFLHEEFTVSVNAAALARARRNGLYEGPNAPEFRYIDKGDKITLVTDGDSEEFTVSELKRGWNFAPEGEVPDYRYGFDMGWALRSDDEDERALAFKKQASGKDVLWLMLSPKN